MSEDKKEQSTRTTPTEGPGSTSPLRSSPAGLSIIELADAVRIKLVDQYGCLIFGVKILVAVIVAVTGVGGISALLQSHHLSNSMKKLQEQVDEQVTNLKALAEGATKSSETAAKMMESSSASAGKAANSAKKIATAGERASQSQIAAHSSATNAMASETNARAVEEHLKDALAQAVQAVATVTTLEANLKKTSSNLAKLSGQIDAATAASLSLSNKIADSEKQLAGFRAQVAKLQNANETLSRVSERSLRLNNHRLLALKQHQTNTVELTDFRGSEINPRTNKLSMTFSVSGIKSGEKLTIAYSPQSKPVIFTLATPSGGTKAGTASNPYNKTSIGDSGYDFQLLLMSTEGLGGDLVLFQISPKE